MSMIKFNLKTKEFAIEGPESFIDANFDKVKELATADHRVNKQRGLRNPLHEKQRLSPGAANPANIEAKRALARNRTHEEPHPDQPATPEAPQEMQPQRPRVRKYILRKASGATAEDPIVTLTKESPNKFSVESLKEKLGVIEEQITGILREAESQGRVRRDVDGSYVWV